MTVLAPVVARVTTPRATVTVSGVTWPPTTASPSPQEALMTVSVRVPVTGFGREQDPGRVRRHQFLDHDGQRDVVVGDAVLVAVGDRARVPQRRPAARDRVQHGVVAADVEVGVLLARERQGRQVLGGGRRAHGHRHGVAERPVGAADLLGHRCRNAVTGEQRLRPFGIPSGRSRHGTAPRTSGRPRS